MGRRPWKYMTAEERAEARREHVRQNVRAYRERNKARNSNQTTTTTTTSRANSETSKHDSQSSSKSQSPRLESPSELSRTSTTTVERPATEPAAAAADEQKQSNGAPHTPVSSHSSSSIVTLARIREEEQEQTHHIRPPSPLITDFDRHSELAPIDISFGTLQAVVEDLEIFAPIWPWRLAAQTLSSDDRLVDLGLLSAGYRLLGKLRQDPRNTAYAWIPYHRTLQQLQRRLDEEVPLDQAFCVLTATASMTLFDATGREDSDENFNLAQAGSVHIRATTELFNRLGPEAFRTPLGLEVLRLRKVQRNLVCLSIRQPSFFADPKWRTSPFLHTAPTLPDDFWLFAEQLSGTFLEIDKLSSSHSPSPTLHDTRLGYLHHLITTKHRFESWLHQLALSHPNTPLYWEVPTTIPFASDPALASVFPTCYQFLDAPTAALMVTYWMFYAHVLRYISNLLDAIAPHYAYLKPSLPPREEISATLLSTHAHIRQSLAYTINESRSNYQALMFSVWLPMTQLLAFYGANDADSGSGSGSGGGGEGSEGGRFQWELRWCFATREWVEEVAMLGQWKGVLRQMGWGPLGEELRKRLVESYDVGGEEKRERGKGGEAVKREENVT